jgi:hypothetical protein
LLLDYIYEELEDNEKVIIICKSKRDRQPSSGMLKNERLESQIILFLRNNKTKGPKKDIQNRIRSHMPGGGEP